MKTSWRLAVVGWRWFRSWQVRPSPHAARLALVLLLAASCTPPATAPMVTPQGDDRFLIDPRIGFSGSLPQAMSQRFDAAWRFVLSGNELEARRRLSEITRRHPDYLPALLAASAFDIRAGHFDAAQGAIAQVLQRQPNYTAARVYEAETAFRDRLTRPAYEIYREVAARPDAPPTAHERLSQLRETLFNELYASAQNAPDSEAVRLLREALAFQPAAVEPRVLLAQKLLSQRQFDEARREIDPLLDTIADRPDIQSLLAEIEVGRGRYQEAITRYDRVVKRTNDPRYAARLEQIKHEWSAANMPPHFRNALASTAVTRAELATLLYWTVPSVRFAQNLGTPPIAVDIEDVEGREEIIRAIALGLFDVDPVTRRVSPYRQMTAARLSGFLARVLTLRGATCARGLPADRVLASCSVTDPLTKYAPDETVHGQDAEAALEQVAKHV